jgi:hypothetical protein
VDLTIRKRPKLFALVDDFFHGVEHRLFCGTDLLPKWTITHLYGLDFDYRRFTAILPKFLVSIVRIDANHFLAEPFRIRLFALAIMLAELSWLGVQVESEGLIL